MNKSLVKGFVPCVALFLVGLTPAAKADMWNKKTVISINQRIQVPNDKVLEPGSYVLKLADSQSDRHIVQIFNADESQIITTILAIPNYRLRPTGKTVISFWETAASEPPAVRAWFYPGDNFGQEFKYRPVQMARIRSRSAGTVVVAQNRATEGTVETSNERTTAREETTTQVAQNTEPTPVAPVEEVTAPAAVSEVTTQSTVAESTPAPQPERIQADQPAELPHTASPYALIMLVGLLSLGAYFMTGSLKRA